MSDMLRQDFLIYKVRKMAILFAILFAGFIYWGCLMNFYSV